MDGVSLSHLLPGLTYELPVSLGAWLISRGVAEEDVTPAIGLVISLDDAPGALTGGVTINGIVKSGR